MNLIAAIIASITQNKEIRRVSPRGDMHSYTSAYCGNPFSKFSTEDVLADNWEVEQERILLSWAEICRAVKVNHLGCDIEMDLVREDLGFQE